MKSQASSEGSLACPKREFEKTTKTAVKRREDLCISIIFKIRKVK